MSLEDSHSTKLLVGGEGARGNRLDAVLLQTTGEAETHRERQTERDRDRKT